MPISQTGAPPQPPNVVSQQQGNPALLQYAQQAAANGASAQPQGDPADAFVKQGLDQIADILGKVAKVITVKRPELIPVVKQMAGAGSTLQQEYSKSQAQGQASPAGQPEPAQEAPEGQATLGL